MTNTEKPNIPSVAEMLRITAENQGQFLVQIAEHIDKLEATVLDLQNKIAKLEETSDGQ